MFELDPIGYIESVFKEKNGTPRQGRLSKHSKATLKINYGPNINADHSLEGLEEYSHVWLIFVFHQNKNQHKMMKIAPPRLEGKKVGVLATRSPHHPNPIGLTAVKLESIEGDTLHLSGTPVLDVKPYISRYDIIEEATNPAWIEESPRAKIENIMWSDGMEEEVKRLVGQGITKYYKSPESLKHAIEEVIGEDPRSYCWKRKNQKNGEAWAFCIDTLNNIMPCLLLY
ncbi:hypothetical protein PROFUN_01660 [Planoprotostelium fungivorum]|uniref:TsaA-like domain-containing protein n=1 Tax=Planoprotostelium fungivorum TaxID=1890364 RepID=A0A2P6MW63_9EUKA|nr:hypothetical protein PROFUN_01660 [Planoprotostelium fungivorum]